MDNFKKIKASRQMIWALALVLALAGIFALEAAEKSDRAFLGVSVQEAGQAQREKIGIMFGVEVVSVEKESAAAKAGIQEGDIIQLANGEKIRHAQDLVDVISELAPGSVVKIGLWRDGKKKDVTASLGKREPRKKFAWKGKNKWFNCGSGAYLGIGLQVLNEDLAPYFKVKAGEGVLIIRVEKDTPAEKAGLKAGDVLVQMGDQKVMAAGDVHQVMAGLKKGDTVAIMVIRLGKKETFKVEPDFNHRKRIFIFRDGHHLDGEHLEIPDLDIEIPSLPDMSRIEEELKRVHENLDHVKVKIEKRLEKIGESFWI
ncbi:MAG: PDZ domain-containing protein [Candidatus Aminicenantes bacterium]|nr:PDZ domain-containing protein [Candidatus Aminicenantes bacterium]